MFGDWQSIMEEFFARKKTASAMGGERKLKERAAVGKLNARQRIDALVDLDSFQELGSLVGGLSHNGFPAAPADAIIGGIAKVNGRSIIVASEDFTVQGGSIGFGTHAKRLRLANLALQERIPLVMMLEGAGERASNGMQRHPYAPNDLQVLAQLKGKVPTIALIMGASAGHGALSGLLMDFIVMVQGSALFSAGPPLVKQSLGEDVNKDELGGASIHTQISGVAHNCVPGEEQAFAAARTYLSYFPQNNSLACPRETNDQTCDPRKLDDIFELIPRNAKITYDIKGLINTLVDDGRWFEVQADYGANIVIGLARLGGYSTAIVANQPMVLAGSIDRAAAEKATRFIQTVGQFKMPVLFIADNPGIMPGSQSERDGTLLAAARMYQAQAKLSSPKMHVTLRKAYGFGSSIMAMNPFDKQTISLALPGISLGGLPAKGGGDAAKMDAATQEKLQSMEEKAAWGAGDSMAYDEIIDPRELRNRLLNALAVSVNR